MVRYPREMILPSCNTLPAVLREMDTSSLARGWVWNSAGVGNLCECCRIGLFVFCTICFKQCPKVCWALFSSINRQVPIPKSLQSEDTYRPVMGAGIQHTNQPLRWLLAHPLVLFLSSISTHTHRWSHSVVSLHLSPSSSLPSSNPVIPLPSQSRPLI